MIVDASVIVAANSSNEPEHAIARAWYEFAIRGDLAAPSILLPEVSPAIARGSRDEELAEHVVANLRSSGIRLVPVDDTLAASAADVARTLRIRGCDAIYVALAARTGETLITLDEEQRQRGSLVATVERPSVPADEESIG